MALMRDFFNGYRFS